MINLKNILFFCLCVLFSLQTLFASPDENIIIENEEFRLTLDQNAQAISLMHKSSGEECLVKGNNAPVFALTEYRPYDAENMLTYVAKSTTYPANKVVRKGNLLKVNFDRIAYTATINLNITPYYIGFKLTNLEYTLEQVSQWKRPTEIDEFTVLQLPIKKRKNFGEWLNVAWDDNVAVNIVGTSQYTKIDAFDRGDHHMFSAGMENKIKLLDVGAALITTDRKKYLDHLDVLEKDYNLPRGVESRRSEEYKYSYYEMRELSPENIDAHIAFAKKGGFRMMVIYWSDFANSLGHFPWKKEKYPNGMADLQKITDKIKRAGMIPGFHIHYNKATRNDAYVTPNPDPRLNLSQIFTLKESIDESSTEIEVEESPHACTMENGRRILKINNELIEYTNYTDTRPYKFTGCKRGLLNTQPQNHNREIKFGLLDVDTSPRYIRFDQRTSIQDEVAERLGKIVDEAGFKFLYFDGGEDVHAPYWYYGSKAQLDVYNACSSKPLFSEGALKTHFSWHIFTRANAYDSFKPEAFREGVRKYMLNGAEYMAENFTSVNFGWNIYLAPTQTSDGYQPDMYEFVCSRAAGWNSPISLIIESFQELYKHPRTEDNLRVIKKWEDARISDVFTDEQKEMMKDPFQEHILFESEQGFELLPYERVENFANNNPEVSAFLFKRNNKIWVVYWHKKGEAKLKIPIAHNLIKLYNQKKLIKHKYNKTDKVQIFPIDNRRFIEFNLPENEVLKVLATSEII